MATELVDFAAEMSRRFGDAGAELFVSNLDVLSKDIEVEAGSVWLQHLKVTQAFLEFFADRLKVQQREAGVRHDLIDAVFALGGEDDLVRLLARVRALQAFVETAGGRDLLAGYKRAANILKKEGYSPSPVQGEGGARSAEPSGRVRVGDSGPHPTALTRRHPLPCRERGRKHCPTRRFPRKLP
jgi:hypothetical protein